MAGRNRKDGTGAQVAPEASRRRVHLDLTEDEAAEINRAEVAHLLATGQRQQAAARVRLRVGVASKTELAELLRLLAAELDAVGNSYDRRGKPARGGWDGTDEGRDNFILNSGIAFAVDDYVYAVIARDLLDGRAIHANKLADFAVRRLRMRIAGAPNDLDGQVVAACAAIEKDPDGERAAILPNAKLLLKELGLDRLAPGKGFRNHAKRIIVEHYAAQYGLTTSQVDRAITKRSKPAQ
ncbi:hypothetical protein IMW82_00795 [Rhodanobacter sp. B2A1Ga4]|uniref:hypothetical protein n=1 Tax=Rhodanobacter TaxID=75309 RepID=UPI000D3CC77D|nr:MULTISPECIES: hypothetical protein [Rhodanobacter]MBQ4853218.1 hypothetical protein [Rhodanobacter sp. B2A1Ga4]